MFDYRLAGIMCHVKQGLTSGAFGTESGYKPIVEFDVESRGMASLSLNKRRWIFITAFWLLFLASIAFAGHYRWIKTAWVGIMLAFAAIGSVYSILEMFRNGAADGNYVYYRGVPRFMRWFVLDDEEYEKDRERQNRATTSKSGDESKHRSS